MILDPTSLRFAVDFANVVLRSYVNNLVEQAAKAKLAQKSPQVKDAVSTQAVDAPKPKSGILLTDM